MRDKIHAGLEVKGLHDFKLFLTFDDGKRKVFDMKPHLWGIWEALNDPNKFFLAYVDYGTVCWPGQLDIDPEILYLDGGLANRKRRWLKKLF